MSSPDPPPIIIATRTRLPHQNRRNGHWWMAIGIGVIALISASVLAALGLRPGGIASVVGTPEQRAVRAWLAENSPESGMKEIRWHPAVNTEELLLCTYKPDGYARAAGYYCEKLKPGKIVKLKYQAKSALGPFVTERGFLIQNGKVTM